jgi:hypothetical protein
VQTPVARSARVDGAVFNASQLAGSAAITDAVVDRPPLNVRIFRCCSWLQITITTEPTTQ